MLVAVHHADVADFFEHAESFLLAREREHSLVLGLAIAARTATGNIDLYSVSDDGETVLAALRAQPRPLLLTDGPPAAAEVLAGLLAQDHRPLHAVHGSIAVAEAFATRYAEHCDLVVEPGRRMRLHATSTVVTLPTIPGRMRGAEPHDLHRLADWYDAFHRMVGEPPPRDPEAAIAAVQSSGRLYVWDDEGEPRSMAAWSRRTPTTVSINLVYTPPEWRARGYATACVAALTSDRLAQGVRECLLFTDLDNPTSNAIYARIGYRPCLDVREFRFGPPPR